MHNHDYLNQLIFIILAVFALSSARPVYAQAPEGDYVPDLNELIVAGEGGIAKGTGIIALIAVGRSNKPSCDLCLKSSE